MPFTSALLMIGALALAGLPADLRLLLQGRDPRLRRLPRRLLLDLRDRRLHRRAADRLLLVPDRLPGRLRASPCEEAQELEQGHLPHAEPENPATGESEDTDVGFPGPSTTSPSASWPMKIAMACSASGPCSPGCVQIPGVDDVRPQVPRTGPSSTPRSTSRARPTAADWHGLAVGGLISVLGIAIAYYFYLRNRARPRRSSERLPRLHASSSTSGTSTSRSTRSSTGPALADRPLRPTRSSSARRPGDRRRRRPDVVRGAGASCAAPSPASCAPTRCC